MVLLVQINKNLELHTYEIFASDFNFKMYILLGHACEHMALILDFKLIDQCFKKTSVNIGPWAIDIYYLNVLLN